MTHTKSEDVNLDNTDEDIPLAAMMTVHKDVPSNVTTGGKVNAQKERTRDNEKFRKKKINENIDRFLELIPNDQKIKLSKNQILERTYDHLAELKGKCQRYQSMDPASIHQERIGELLAENDRLRKENECFLEIFRTLNIQPNGLLEMNHQLKTVTKKDEKLAQSLLSPTTQTFNQNMLISPPGQCGDSSGQAGGVISGQGLLSPTIVNGNLVLPQHSQGSAPDLNLDNTCIGGTPKKEGGIAKNELIGQPPEDMDKVLREMMEDAASSGDSQLLKSPDGGNISIDSDIKTSINPSSVTVTSSSQVFVNVSTHQPSVTPNEGEPKLTSAATTPATMVTQSLSGPITTTAGSTSLANVGQNFVSGQANTTMSSGLKVTPSVSGAVVSSAQPNVVLQQPGQTLLLSLPGRPGLIPVKMITPPKHQPVLLPNQGQCGNLAKQLSNTPQKRRPIKIKEQGTGAQQQIGLGGPSTSQTMTVRLAAPQQPGGGGGVVLNSGGQMMMQQTVQQPVVINTPGGGQQTVLMQVPLQIQQPVVQPPQQVVYIQQNGQLIPVVVNPPAQQPQQVVSNPVIMNNPLQQQQQQGQSSISNQPVTTSISETPPTLNQPNPLNLPNSTMLPIDGSNQPSYMAGQVPQGGGAPSTNGPNQIGGAPNINGNSTIGVPQGFIPSDPGKDPLQGVQYANAQKPLNVVGADQDRFSAVSMANNSIGGIDDNADDILAQAAEHIFTHSGDGPQQQEDNSHLGGMDSSSTQEETSHSSKHKKKKKKKEKEKKEKEKKEKERKEKEKRKKREREKKKRNKAQSMQAETASVSKESDFSSSGQAFLESFLQESDDQRVELRNNSLPDVSDLGMVPSQGDFLPSYPTGSQMGGTPTSQPDAVGTSATNDSSGGDSADILSNSMNFIGLPTLNEEEEVKVNGKDSKEMSGGVTDVIPVHHIEDEEEDDDDDDDDPEAHAFSPPCSPETTEEQNNQMLTDNVPGAQLEVPPKSTIVSETAGIEQRTMLGSDHGIGVGSDHGIGVGSDVAGDKSPPPPYPVGMSKMLNTVQQQPSEAIGPRPFDILSQPWVTQTVTSSSPQSFGTVASVPSQRINVSENSHAPASSQVSSYHHNNFSGFLRNSEPQHFNPSSIPANLSAAHIPETSSLSQAHSKAGTTEQQVTPPSFNFYSSTPFSKASDLPGRDLSLKEMSDNSVTTFSSISPTSSIVTPSAASSTISLPTVSMSSGILPSPQRSRGIPSQENPMSSGHLPSSQRPEVNLPSEGLLTRPGALNPGTIPSALMSTGGLSSTGSRAAGNPTPPGTTLPQGTPSPGRLSSRVTVSHPPHRHPPTPMRALEKPPKSFTKANIHRTLTSFDKEEEDKWAKEKERLAKEAAKQSAAAAASNKDGKKPATATEGNDDQTGHRALDKDLVSKFPWLADEDEPSGKKGNSGKLTSRNPTPFSVQSIAQSSASKMTAARRSDSRKGQEKPKVTPPMKEDVQGKPTNPQLGDGGAWNLWNPSFSKGNQKLNSTTSTDEVAIIKEKTQLPTHRTLKSVLLNDQSLALSTTSVPPKAKRKIQATQQNISKTDPQVVSSRKGVSQPVVPSGMEGPLPGSISSSSLPPYSTSHMQQVSESMSVPFSQYSSSNPFSSEPQNNSKPFVSKVPSQSPFLKASAMENSSVSTTSQEREPGDLFQSSLDFLFEKTDQADLADNMVTSLHQVESNPLPPLSKHSSVPAPMRNFEQANVTSPYGQQSPVNLGRQMSHPNQRTSSSAPPARSIPSQPVSTGVKRLATQVTSQTAPSKRQQKEGDIFRGSPSLSDSSHLGSPDTGSYGSPMMPADSQTTGPAERYRYQQGGMQGYPSQTSMSSSNVQTNYHLGRVEHQGGHKKPNPSMDAAAEVKRSKALHGQMRNPVEEIQAWTGQGLNQLTQGSRGLSRHGERSNQNATAFASEMTSTTVPSSTFSQSDLSTNPGNGGLLSSLSPTRHLRPNELPTYLPSIAVRNPILTSPPYPGKTGSTREPEINFESMFASTRPNTLPLNVPHNYSMFPDHPPGHASGLSTVKHGHVPGHMGNSSATPFNFSNIFSEPSAAVSSSQVHTSQGLHPAMHLGNTLQSPAEDVRGGVNQRHRNQQLPNAPGMRLDHLFNPNPMGVGSMGVPPHPFVPGMPPY